MRDIDEKIKILWDQRSEKYKDNIAGVLPKSFPLPVNQYLDEWEFNLTAGLVKNETGYKVLDIGSGYGRLSKRILKKFVKVETLGIDIARNYVDIYNKNLKPRGHAYIGDIRDLPFKNKSVNLVLVVTSLMYIIRKHDQEKAFKEIFRVLKDNGKLLLIERDVNGYNLITFWGLIDRIRGEKNKEITAVSFSPQDVGKLVRGAGGSIEKMFGLPAFTLSLPIFFVLDKFKNKKAMMSYLDFVKALDGFLRSIIYPSIYIAYIASKT